MCKLFGFVVVIDSRVVVWQLHSCELVSMAVFILLYLYCCRILPMRQQPETSAKVLIQHDRDTSLNEEHKTVKIQAIFSVVSKPLTMNTLFFSNHDSTWHMQKVLVVWYMDVKTFTRNFTAWMKVFVGGNRFVFSFFRHTKLGKESEKSHLYPPQTFGCISVDIDLRK